MIDRTVAWTPVAWQGYELNNVQYNESQQLIHIDGKILAVDEGLPISVQYHLVCNPKWELQEIFVSKNDYSAEQGKGTHLKRTLEGNWKNHLDEVQPQFNGFTEVDISLTPFTNTLPIRRLNLDVGEAREIDVIYFLAPALEPTPARQRYTCLEKRGDGGGLYRLDWEEINFTVDIPVDADGLVLDYPELFKRVWSKHP